MENSLNEAPEMRNNSFNEQANSDASNLFIILFHIEQYWIYTKILYLKKNAKDYIKKRNVTFTFLTGNNSVVKLTQKFFLEHSNIVTESF